MAKILVDKDRLDLLVVIVFLSDYCILKNGNIEDCLDTSCSDCIFGTTLTCKKGILDWVKGE